MRARIFKYVIIIGLCFLMMNLVPESSNAIPIEEIVITSSLSIYDIDLITKENSFSIYGHSDAVVYYNDSDYITLDVSFDLDTTGLVSNVSSDQKKVTYSENGRGMIRLQDWVTEENYLVGELIDLELILKNVRRGEFEGAGNFWVTEGSLIDDFGNNGGLATIGIAFKVPADFSRPFLAVANTSLYPIRSIPEPSIILLLGSLIFGVGFLERKRYRG